MKKAVFTGFLILASNMPAFSEETKDCYSIIEPSQGSSVQFPLKINRCDGTTWVLVRVYLKKTKDGPPGPYVLRWFHILIDSSTEAEIGNF